MERKRSLRGCFLAWSDARFGVVLRVEGFRHRIRFRFREVSGSGFGRFGLYDES